ncbi:MAG: hypothetical protein HUU50_03955 [Candidatus Brocadiae bacterium]|nr:hypothetical protein [Candidatus Brocadiia bacterium]
MSKKEKQEVATKPDPDIVFNALKHPMKADKEKLFEFITPKKVEKLLQEYGESKEN